MEPQPVNEIVNLYDGGMNVWSMALFCEVCWFIIKVFVGNLRGESLLCKSERLCFVFDRVPTRFDHELSSHLDLCLT